MPTFSIYTPTHDLTWIKDAYRSIVAQTDPDWEWILLRNGKSPQPMPSEISRDSRVKIFESNMTKIGGLKKAAVASGTGRIFVELDHDDQLASDCLRELRHASDKTPDGFYYSDFANVFDNGAPEVFSSEYGWEKFEAKIDGVNRLCQRSFDPCPRSLCEIWYAPNHVRAWSRAAYEKTGGYNHDLEVGDDHDLICRSYLARVPFVHIAKPLYVYRRHSQPKIGNTFQIKHQKIMKANYDNMNRFFHPLIEEWCRREGLLMLDLGGAHNSPPGYKSVDRVPPADVIWDLANADLPFEESSIGCVRAFDFVEHLPRARYVPFMNDVHRVLRHGGFFISATPSTDGRGAFQDPTHTNFINENSWLYFTHRDFSKYLNGAVKCRFQATRLWTETPSDWHKRMMLPYVYADLMAVKEFHHVGPISI